MDHSITLLFSSEDEATSWFESARSNGCVSSEMGLRQADPDINRSESNVPGLLATTESRSSGYTGDWAVQPEPEAATA